MSSYDTIEYMVASVLLKSTVIYLELNLEDENSLKVALYRSNQFDIILYNGTTWWEVESAKDLGLMISNDDVE